MFEIVTDEKQTKVFAGACGDLGVLNVSRRLTTKWEQSLKTILKEYAENLRKTRRITECACAVVNNKGKWEFALSTDYTRQPYQPACIIHMKYSKRLKNWRITAKTTSEPFAVSAATQILLPGYNVTTKAKMKFMGKPTDVVKMPNKTLVK